jgi:hypothetical protein
MKVEKIRIMLTWVTEWRQKESILNITLMMMRLTTSTQMLSTQMLSTQMLSTQMLPTQMMPNQMMPNQMLPTKMLPTQTPSPTRLPTRMPTLALMSVGVALCGSLWDEPAVGSKPQTVTTPPPPLLRCFFAALPLEDELFGGNSPLLDELADAAAEPAGEEDPSTPVHQRTVNEREVQENQPRSAPGKNFTPVISSARRLMFGIAEEGAAMETPQSNQLAQRPPGNRRVRSPQAAHTGLSPALKLTRSQVSSHTLLVCFTFRLFIKICVRLWTQVAQRRREAGPAGYQLRSSQNSQQ